MRSLAICVLARVITKIKLPQIAMKMLAANVMIDSVYSALESGKVTLDGVCCNADAFVIAHVFISGRLHGSFNR